MLNSPANACEQHRVRGLARRQGLRRKRIIYRVESGATNERVRELKFEATSFPERLEDCDRSRRDFWPDAITGQQGDFVYFFGRR